MTLSAIPKLVLGHNQFFGVDHLSSQRGAERATYFSEIGNVLEVVRLAQNAGATGLMLSTHPRALAICEAIRNDANLRTDLRIVPLLPYAQKYVTKANEVGMVRAVTETLSHASISDRLSLGLDFVRTLLRRDPIDMIRALIGLEMRVFSDLSVPVVFLHDAVSDLLLALGAPQVFDLYRQTLKKRFGAEAGVATKNLPLLIDRFTEWGLEKPAVLTHVNKIGFHVNPSVRDHEQCLQDETLHVMAMGTLASGFLKPVDAALYVQRFPAIKSIVIGASSPTHIIESFAAHLPV